MIYQMVSPVDIDQKTYNECMHYKFFISHGFSVNGFPVMHIGYPYHCFFYSEGNLIIEDIPNDRNETPDTTT